MGPLTVLLRAMRGSHATEPPTPDEPTGRQVRCRNCGRYYADGTDACPACGSGNQLRSGPPNGQRRR
jgi:ribosomal protein L37E